MELRGSPSPEDVLRMDLAALRDLRPGHFHRDMTDVEFRHIFETCGALWLHSGNPQDPHAELTSGLCSDGFVNVGHALQYASICELMAEQIVRRLCRQYEGKVDWVIGSDHAGATLSFAVAAQLSARHDFTEKAADGSHLWKRLVIEPGEVVLQVEELITTAKTLQAVRDAIRAGNPHPVTFAPLSMVLVHRSEIYEFEGTPIIPAAHYDIRTWKPEECPLCKAGSQRLRPKKNWEELTSRGSKCVDSF